MSNKESRNVHSAVAALATYIAADRNLAVLRTFPIGSTTRYDVWQGVFKKEKEALRFLQEQELIDLLTKYGNTPDYMHSSVAMLCVCRLEQITEWDSPLSLNDAIKIILDCLGDAFLPVLIKEAEVCWQRRKDIIKPYFKHDDEWVKYSEKVVKALKKLNI